MTAGVYLHIPFCKSRCSYCDFATDVYRSNDAVERYVNALCRELSLSTTPASQSLGHPSLDKEGSHGELPSYLRRGGIPTRRDAGVVSNKKKSLIDTIYFGGGTPSLLSPVQVEKILTAVSDKFEVAANPEITMEMNPATVSPETLAGYRSLGVDRASFGVQTFDDRALKLLARGHDANDARTTFRLLRDAGFENISFDLIAGLPNQSLEQWNRNLAEAVSMQPEHISLYLLEIHEGTPLAEQIRSGRQPSPDEDLAAEMYEVMLGTLASAGYAQYEISNFAKPGFESRHNSKYWRLDPVYGFGVSAHSFDGTERYANERDTNKYVELIEAGGSAEMTRELIDAASEFVFLGLRLNEGIGLEEFESRFGEGLSALREPELRDLLEKGLVEIADDRLRLTRRGMLFSNEVFAEFV